MSWWKPKRISLWQLLPDSQFGYGVIERGDYHIPEQYYCFLWLPSYFYGPNIVRDECMWQQRGVIWLGVDGFKMMSRPVIDTAVNKE